MFVMTTLLALNSSLCLMFMVYSGAQTDMQAAAESQSVTHQPWLVGLTAVVGFLFIVFTILIIHRLLKKNRSAACMHASSKRWKMYNCKILYDIIFPSKNFSKKVVSNKLFFRFIISLITYKNMNGK